MTNVIGIDPSLTATGIATEAETYVVRTDSTTPRRLAVIYDGAYTAVTNTVPVDLAVVEDLPTHAHGAGLTGMAQGVIRLALLEMNVPFVTVPAASLKKFATGSGNANKADMRLELFKRAGVDIRDDNEVDAWWLRQIGLHLLGSPDAIPLPQTHLEALKKVNRP